MAEDFPTNLQSLFSYVRSLKSNVEKLTNIVMQERVQSGLPAALPGQYAGKPIPSIEGVELDVAANTNQVSGNIVLQADGPFMARAVHFAWLPSNSNIWRPISSVNDLAVAGTDVINFKYEISATGSRRNRMNIPVPSALVTRAEEGNGFMDSIVPDVFDPSTTIMIKITPTVAPAHAGVMYVGFDGAYILP